MRYHEIIKNPARQQQELDTQNNSAAQITQNEKTVKQQSNSDDLRLEREARTRQRI